MCSCNKNYELTENKKNCSIGKWHKHRYSYTVNPPIVIKVDGTKPGPTWSCTHFIECFDQFIKMWKCIILVHPCDRDNKGGCEQVCEKDGAKAKCGCKEGFEITDDGITCKKGKFNTFRRFIFFVKDLFLHKRLFQIQRGI